MVSATFLLTCIHEEEQELPCDPSPVEAMSLPNRGRNHRTRNKTTFASYDPWIRMNFIRKAELVTVTHRS